METTNVTSKSGMEFVPLMPEDIVSTEDSWIKESLVILGKEYPATQGKAMEYNGELKKELDKLLIKFNKTISKHADELIALNAFGYSMSPRDYVNWVAKTANGYTLEELRKANKQLDTMCQFEDIRNVIQQITDFENRNRHVVKEYLGIAG